MSAGPQGAVVPEARGLLPPEGEVKAAGGGPAGQCLDLVDLGPVDVPVLGLAVAHPLVGRVRVVAVGARPLRAVEALRRTAAQRPGHEQAKEGGSCCTAAHGWQEHRPRGYLPASVAEAALHHVVVPGQWVVRHAAVAARQEAAPRSAGLSGGRRAADGRRPDVCGVAEVAVVVVAVAQRRLGQCLHVQAPAVAGAHLGVAVVGTAVRSQQQPVVSKQQAAGNQ